MLDFEHLEKQLQENNEMLKDFSSRIAEIEDKLERNKVLTNTLYEVCKISLIFHLKVSINLYCFESLRKNSRNLKD